VRGTGAPFKAIPVLLKFLTDFGTTEPISISS